MKKHKQLPKFEEILYYPVFTQLNLNLRLAAYTRYLKKSFRGGWAITQAIKEIDPGSLVKANVSL